MKKITVKVSPRPYDVLIEHGIWAQAGEHVPRALGGNPSLCLVVTSPSIRALWGKMLEGSLRRAGMPFRVVEIPDGERFKTMRAIERLVNEFAASGADRGSAVAALGGGVVGDLAGFAASIYMRGIPVVQIPTTLLAQVDASVGGKTGANLPAGKNLVGAFHQPRLALVDPHVLSTLPEREFRAGLFEAIKCGVIADAGLFEFIANRRKEILRREEKALIRIIAASVRVKARVVAADEREGGLRRALNFGHTIGHALEAESSYRRYLHGEAVAWGMIAVARIGSALGITHSAVAERIESVVRLYGPLPPVNAKPGAVMKLLNADKKTVAGVPHFVLAKRIGEVVITNNVPARAISAVVSALRSQSQSKSK